MFYSYKWEVTAPWSYSWSSPPSYPITRLWKENMHSTLLYLPLALKMCVEYRTRQTRWMYQTRQSKQCRFSIYIFDNSKSKSMVRLVRSEKMALSGLVFARKIARMILIQNIQGLMGPLMINMAFMPLYMWEMWDVTPVTNTRTDSRKVGQYSVWPESAINQNG